MITYKYVKVDNFYKEFSLSGHAFYSYSGNDIVCSAVTSALRLTHLLLEDVLGSNISTHINEAKPEIVINIPIEDYKLSFHAIEALTIYIKELKKEYPNFIDILEA